VVSLARNADESLEFAALYAEMSRTWRSRCRLPRAFFVEVQRARSARVVLLLARHHGRLVAGNLALLHREGAVSWCGVMRKECRDLHPAVALHEETITQACAAGCPTYDLGPSPALPGVERFKREFGAEPRSFASWTVLSPLGCVIERLRPALLRATDLSDGGTV
jgi:lipid II:glycine glycyltransferase (peptidoglycan interpeptide bridge formation enzyme)